MDDSPCLFAYPAVQVNTNLKLSVCLSTRPYGCHPTFVLRQLGRSPATPGSPRWWINGLSDRKLKSNFIMDHFPDGGVLPTISVLASVGKIFLKWVFGCSSWCIHWKSFLILRICPRFTATFPPTFLMAKKHISQWFAASCQRDARFLWTLAWERFYSFLAQCVRSVSLVSHIRRGNNL